MVTYTGCERWNGKIGAKKDDSQKVWTSSSCGWEEDAGARMRVVRKKKKNYE
jgi:hypothetical protein